MITTFQKAWMAGVLDLKGRLSYKRNATRRNSPQITLSVESKELLIIRELSWLTGTAPEERNASSLSEFNRRGCTEHCPEPHMHVENTWQMPNISRWTVTGVSMVIVLKDLEPFITIDRGYQAAIQEVELNAPLSGRGVNAIMRAAARLQALGWTVPDPYAEVLRNHLFSLIPLDGDEPLATEEGASAPA